MSTSDIKYRSGRTAAAYLSLSVFCAVFGMIYELNSFGVFSFFMTFCFLPTLILGALPFGIFFIAGLRMPGRLSFNLYNSGVAALTIGFIFKGVIDIYGTTNRLLSVYFICGALFIVSSAVCFAFGAKKRRKTT